MRGLWPATVQVRGAGVRTHMPVKQLNFSALWFVQALHAVLALCVGSACVYLEWLLGMSSS
jgi:hypothetical protein